MMNRKKIGIVAFVTCLLIFVVLNFFLWRLDPASIVGKSATIEAKKATRSSEEDVLASASLDDWELVLVNRDHLFESEPKSLATVGDIQVDSRIAAATQDFLAAAQVIVPDEVLLSGYRSRAEQEQLYNERVAELEASGVDRAEAEATVRSQVQKPGASEHQTGLAIDMSEEAGQLDEVAEKIKQLAPQYGFILRYPEGKSHITGIEFESWHFRYVGVKNAQYMQQHNLVLEEYRDLLKGK
ncbi:M15 family metallopeptidase [Streptococcus respiraculi]|uniref:M15 family metallopeptidase n=1 Tax=Streptococcus respiraculi TaxID=2021971 RepID=UPI000E7382B9|nr:M15 family metallopeptidase [Streptococcus respiraculi]